MTEPTIENLVDDVVNKTKYLSAAEIAVKGQNEPKAKQELAEARAALLSSIDQLQHDVDEFRKIKEWIKSQPGCPEDSEIVLEIPNSSDDKRLWFEVISNKLALQSYEPDTNSSDPCWHSFELITTNEIFLEKQEADEWRGVAKQLADELTKANAERFPISWEDASESSPAWIAYVGLRDSNLKTSSDNNK